MNNSTYNEDARFLELLRKWQSGDFTRSDEQEMYALAAGDEFRREALEGYMDHPEHDHARSLDDLKKRLYARKRRRAPFPQIWALAAALILLFGAIWFFNIRPIPVETGEVAQNNAPPTGVLTEPEPPAISSPNTPSGARALDPLPPRTPVASGPADDMAAQGKMAERNTSMDKAADQESADLAATEETFSAPMEAPGTISSQSTNMLPPRELAEEAASRASKKKESAKPAPSYQEDKADKAQKAKSAPASQPAGGWESFRQYLNNNARLTPEALANNVSGTVRLQFTLDSNNQPVDFKVIKGIGYGCDETAIRLVKAYTWMRGDDQPVTVDAPFVR